VSRHGGRVERLRTVAHRQSGDNRAMPVLRIVRAALCSALLLTTLCPALAAPRVPVVPSPPAGYEAREDVSAFIKDLVQHHPDLDEEVVATTLSEARYQAQVAKFILPAASPAAKNWKVYRSRFLDTLRVREGVNFWRDNEACAGACRRG
jgi:membrane-bound lytic murein transglycosylase B